MKNIILLLSVILILGGCSSTSYDDCYTEEDVQKVEVSNPYSEGSGHFAGYEWAEKTGGSCDGNSQSFNEGCEEYYRQIRQ